jgi:hypothetical protein
MLVSVGKRIYSGPVSEPIEGEAPSSGLLPWEIQNSQIAFTALDSAGYDGNTLYNLAPSNSNLTMNVVGNPQLVNSTIEFGVGQYAVGDFYEFSNILPNVDNGTGTTDFTFIVLFEGGGKDERNRMFDIGFSPSFRMAYQYSSGAVFGSIVKDINGNQVYFTHNGNHERFVGDGENYNFDEVGNQFIGKLGMMGYRSINQGGADYLIEDILDGKPTATWNPPSDLVTSTVMPLNFTWQTASWAARKPVINGDTTNSSAPSSTGTTKFKGLYYYDRALTDAEIQSIYDSHNI